MKKSYASYESFCSRFADCSKCPLGQFKKSRNDCRRLYREAINNNGNITVNINSKLLDK